MSKTQLVIEKDRKVLEVFKCFDEGEVLTVEVWGYSGSMDIDLNLKQVEELIAALNTLKDDYQEKS